MFLPAFYNKILTFGIQRSHFATKSIGYSNLIDQLRNRKRYTEMASQRRQRPLHYLIPIFPGFQLLDVSGPLDILNLLSLDPSASNITLTFIADTLDPVSVKPKPPPKADWKFDLSSAYPGSNGTVNLSFNQTFTPSTTYDDYLAALPRSAEGNAAKPIDVMLIPGGVGTRLDRIYSDGKRTSNVQTLIDFIPKIAPSISTAIITVCTGSHVLAQTSLLNSRRATTNMARFEDVASSNTRVKWQKGARWVKSLPSESQENAAKDLEIWSSAGISAGMDVTLAFIEDYYGGRQVSRELAKRLEYDWREIEESGIDPMYEKYFGVTA